MFTRGGGAQNASNFGITKWGNFGITKWDFFSMAMLTRLSAAIGAASDGRNRVGRRLTDYSAFHLDAGLEDQDCNLFWLIGSFVNLLSKRKRRVFGSIPNVQFIAAQTPSTDTDPHPARRYRRCSRVAGIAHNILIAPNII
ncbi:hypothetical protein [Rhizobium leguminosarum]|uniref:hypothetical protein n=1 Tax=Rhizobium leguminosarum TaxID=384 RepID=UPI0021BBE538|nr:hypothetical protein [Rhizobium leguminosarum]